MHGEPKHIALSLKAASYGGGVRKGGINYAPILGLYSCPESMGIYQQNYQLGGLWILHVQVRCSNALKMQHFRCYRTEAVSQSGCVVRGIIFRVIWIDRNDEICNDRTWHPQKIESVVWKSLLDYSRVA
jgi:hypothetical protein